MPELETKVAIDFHLKCNECGNNLSCDITEDKWGCPVIKVDLCSDCLTAELEKGIEEGEKNAQ